VAYGVGDELVLGALGEHHEFAHPPSPSISSKSGIGSWWAFFCAYSARPS
jgi:hypothetical protein